jgi:hypothetical protein
MFDMLTLDELNKLHDSLHRSHGKLHARLTGPDRQIPFGPDWNIAHAAACDMTDTLIAVGAEITRRRVSYKYCRTCGFADCPGAVTGDCPRWPARDDQARADA